MKKHFTLIAAACFFSAATGLFAQTEYSTDAFGLNALFQKWHNSTQSYNGPGLALSVMADQNSCSWGNAAMQDMSSEPRMAFPNYTEYNFSLTTLRFWNRLYQVIDTANFILSETGSSIHFGPGGSDNDLARAFSYFNRGLAYGYLALVFDKAVLKLDPMDDMLSLPWATNAQIMAVAENDLLQAMDLFINLGGGVYIPENWIRGHQFNGNEMAALCRSFLARILVYNSRKASQNSSLDWTYVNNLLQDGMSSDLAPDADDIGWVDELKIYSQYPNWLRVDHRIIHLLDPGYPSRWPYDNYSWDTPDGNDPGEASSADARLLSDFRYLEDNNFYPSRGYYHFSHYQNKRYEDYLSTWTGPVPAFLKWENDLLLAESYLMQGNLTSAIAILNDPAGARKSRGGLPDIDAGASSAELLEIIYYERDIELMISGMGTGFFDMRRRDALQKGTPLHFPVPAAFLEERGESLYTFGGQENADGIHVADGSNSWDNGFYYTLDKTGCDYGASDWTITFDPPSVNPPYQYSIDDGATFVSSGIFSNLGPDMYYLRVKDALGNISYLKTVNLEEFLLTTNKINSCFESNSGSITAVVTGGVKPYTYLWSNGKTGNRILNLSPGIYELTVTDATGCSLVASDTIYENEEIPVPVITGPSEVLYLQQTYLTVPQQEGTDYFWNLQGNNIVWQSSDRDSVLVKWVEKFETIEVEVRARVDGCYSEPGTFETTMNPVSAQSDILFRDWMNTVHEYKGPAMAMAVMADQHTCSWGNSGMKDLSSEPRKEFINTSTYTYKPIVQNYWNSLYSVIDRSRELVKMAEALPDVPENEEFKHSMMAWGYLNMGLAHGYLSLVFDQAYLVDLDTDTENMVLQPYTDINAFSLACLDACIDISNTHSFNLLPEFIRGSATDNVAVSMMANSFAARFILYNTRNREMNELVDWTKLLSYAENGFNSDLAIEIGDDWYDRANFYLNNNGWGRIDHRIIHLMDPAYPSRWPDDNMSWDTPDGQDPGPASSPDQRLETDFQYLETNDFRHERGYYHFSHYRYGRYDEFLGTYPGSGLKPIFLKAETDLIRAEAYLRLGNHAAYLNMMNNGTRVSRGGLPALSGGESMEEKLEALFYERDVELISSSVGIGFFDMRRRDMHQVGTLLHFPVPADVLKGKALPTYTHGGVERADGWNTADGSNQWDRDIFVEIDKAGCVDDNDWTITIHPLKGIPPYSYTVTGVGTQSDPVFSGLVSGSYEIIVEDATEAGFTTSIDLFSLSLTWHTVDACYGSETGQAHLDINGGVAPVTVSWSNGEQNDHVDGLAPGSYLVTVTDAIGCSVNETLDIFELEEIPVPVLLGPTQVNPGDSVVYYVDDPLDTYRYYFGFYGASNTWRFSNDSVAVRWADPLPDSAFTRVFAQDWNTLCYSESNYVYLNQAQQEEHFKTIWTGNGVDHMNFYTLTAKLDGEDMVPGDEIAVFDGAHCVGAAVLTEILVDGVNYLSFVASKNDASPPEVNGYTPGNNISFRIWDASEQKEIDRVQVSYTTGTGIFEVGGTAAFHLNASSQVDQTIALSEGWNIMSFYVQPEDMSMTSIVQPLISGGSLVKVQDETGAAIEDVPPIGWIYNIDQMANTEGYKIKVNQNTALSSTGFEVAWPFAIPLSEGWNIMGYPGSQNLSTATAIDDLIAAGHFIKMQDETGAAVEYVVPIGWVYNIHDLMPGEGYKIKVSVNTSLILSESGKKSGIQATPLVRPEYFRPAWTGNGLDHMNLYLRSVTWNGMELKPGDEIGVFDNELCVGYGVVGQEQQAYIPLIASFDDPTTPNTDGFTEGGSISLRVWIKSMNQEYTVEQLEFLPGYRSVFEKMGTTVADVEFSGTGSFTGRLGPVYPNPMTDRTEIYFTLAQDEHVRIELYNMLGQKLGILLDEQRSAGPSMIEWLGTDATGARVKQGIYLLKMLAGEQVKTEKIVVE